MTADTLSFGLGGDNTNLDALTLPAPRVEGDTAVYLNIAPDTVPGLALAVRATGRGFAHWLVLTQRPTADQADDLALPLTVTDTGRSGAVDVTRQTSGALKVVDSADPAAALVSAAPPVAWDASTQGPDETDPARMVAALAGSATPAAEPDGPFDGATSSTGPDSSGGGSADQVTDQSPVQLVDTTVTNDVAAGVDAGETGKPALSSVVDLAVDPEFLLDPSTQFPVTIDPSFTAGTSGDTWIQKPDYTAGQPSSTELRVGTKDGGDHVARSYIRFSNGTFVGKHITGAQLVLRNFDQSSCSAGTIQVAQITGTWDPSTLTWGTQPAVGGVGVNANGLSYDCPDNHSATWPITAIAQSWSNGANQYGLRVMATNETYNATYRRYRSANFTDDVTIRPHLEVTYNSYPSAATNLSVSTLAGQSVTSSTPTISAGVSDSDGGALRLHVKILQGSTPIIDTYGSKTATLAAGAAGSASYTVPAGTLSAGTTYTAQVWTNDSIDDAKTATTKTFTVNHTPASPTSIGMLSDSGAVMADPIFTLPSQYRLAATVSDADGPSWAHFSLVNESGDEVWSGDGSKVAAGAKSVAVVPTDKLALYGSYQVNVSTSDGNLASPVVTSALNMEVSPSDPQDAAMSPCLDSCDLEWQFTNSTTPTLSATAHHDAGTALTYGWEVAKASDGSIVATGTSSSQPDVTATWQVPAGILSDDGLYTYHVRATADGTNWSAWSPSSPLGIDVDAANIPQSIKDEAILKFAGLMSSETAVWNNGAAAVSSPSATDLQKLGGPSSALTTELTRTLDTRSQLLGEDLTLSGVSTSNGTREVHVRKVGSTYLATTVITTALTETEADGTQVDSSWDEVISLGFATSSTPSTNPVSTIRTGLVAPDAPAGGSGEPTSLTSGSPVYAAAAATEGVDDDEPQASSDDRSAATEAPAATLFAASAPKRSYDPGVAALNALTYTDTGHTGNNDLPGNGVYPSYLKFSNNCTNFISRLLDIAGWTPTGGMNPYKSSNWDYNLTGPAKWSHTWSVASEFYKYAKGTKHLRWMPNIWQAQRGDLYFVDWGNDKDKDIDHALTVTNRSSSGMPYISQKTNNRHNMPLDAYIQLAKNGSSKGVSVWYGLEDWVD